MFGSKRLDRVFEIAERIQFTDDYKFVFFSDCHRGDNSWADDFAHNQNLYFYALKEYYEKGFIYIEIGDGDELWENRKFKNIRQAHSDVFWLMNEFYKKGRFRLVHGNHDKDWHYPRKVAKNLFRFFDERDAEYKPLFENIKVHEGLLLSHSDSGRCIFLVHGHQVDFFSGLAWRLSKIVVRYVWKQLQLIGVKDPTSPAKNFKRRNKVEKKLIDWLKEKEGILIAGHTHRSKFPSKGEPLYFNTGSCVHPRCITGIEIENGEITLVKWLVKPDTNGFIKIEKEILEGPQKIQNFSQSNQR